MYFRQELRSQYSNPEESLHGSDIFHSQTNNNFMSHNQNIRDDLGIPGVYAIS